jgi:haloacetate dehalogenase
MMVGRLAFWRRWAANAHGRPVEGGHFFPKNIPGQLAQLIRSFLLGAGGVWTQAGA